MLVDFKNATLLDAKFQTVRASTWIHVLEVEEMGLVFDLFQPIHFLCKNLALSQTFDNCFNIQGSCISMIASEEISRSIGFTLRVTCSVELVPTLTWIH